MNKFISSFSVLGLCVLAACGGGGGGGALPSIGGGSGGSGGITSVSPGLPSPTPQGSPSAGASATPGPGFTPTPAPGTTATPAPGTSPTPVPSGFFASGSVRDIDSGRPIAGAEVVIEPQVVPGATPPPNPTASATTAPDGSFTVAPLLPGSNYLEVFQPGDATLHEKFNITSFATQIGSITMTHLTSDELAWLAETNADRARYNAAPLVFDEILQEGARHWSAYMAGNGWYQTFCPSSDPSCLNAIAYEQFIGGTYTSSGSNIDSKQPPSTWQSAENDFIAQSNACPPPPSFATCPSGPNTQKFLNLINPNFIWVGLATAPGGKSSNPGFFSDYYDQELGTPYQGT